MLEQLQIISENLKLHLKYIPDLLRPILGFFLPKGPGLRCSRR